MSSGFLGLAGCLGLVGVGLICGVISVLVGDEFCGAWFGLIVGYLNGVGLVGGFVCRVY